MNADHLPILGGIGIFLLGMPVLTDGLRALAGGSLRRILARSTRNPATGAERLQPFQGNTSFKLFTSLCKVDDNLFRAKDFRFSRECKWSFRNHEQSIRRGDGGMSPSNIKIADTERLLRAQSLVMDLMNDVVFITNSRALILDSNDAATQILGWTREELLGQRLSELWETANVRGATLLQIDQGIREGGAWRGECQVTRKDGGDVDLEVTAYDFPGEDDGNERRVVILRDISERKAVEEALRQSQHRLTEANRIGRVGHWELDVLIWRVRLQGELYREFGASAVETDASYEASLASVHDDDKDRMRAACDRSLADGTRFDETYRIYRRDSGISYVRAIGEAYRDEAGAIIGFRGTLQDESEQREAEEALRLSGARLQEAHRLARLGHWQYDGASEMFAVHGPVFTELGYAEDPAKFSAAESFAGVYQEDSKHLSELFRRSMTEGCRLETIFRLEADDGSLVHLHLIGEVVRDAQGKIVGMYGTTQDVTEVAVANEALSNSEARLRATMEGSLDGVYFHKAVRNNQDAIVDFEFVDVNGRGIDMLEYSRTELVGSRLSETFPESFENGLFERLKVVLDTGQPLAEEMPAQENVDAQWLYYQIVPYGDGVAFTVRDVTEIRQAEQKLQQAQKMEVVGQLTGGIAHDFNNLLAIITGNLDLARNRVQSDPELDSMLKAGISASERGAELTRQLLAFSRRQTLTPRPTNTNDLIERVLGLGRRTLGEAVEVAFQPVEDAWWAHIDPAQLESALLNLAINARDAMPGGGILTIRTQNLSANGAAKSGPEIVAPGDYVVIEVKDTGSGMTENVRQKAFEPFFTTKEVGQGSGMGLSMVYGFANQSGGHVELKSTVGEGTVIRLYLPRSEPDEQVVAAQKEATAKATGEGKTVLIVEDDEQVRQLVIALVEGLGYGVLHASNAAAALEIVHVELHIDLLLSDVVLGRGMNGVELANRIRKEKPDFPVLLMSGYARDAVEQGNDSGEDYDLIGKPFRIGDLADRIEALLR